MCFNVCFMFLMKKLINASWLFELGLKFYYGSCEWNLFIGKFIVSEIFSDQNETEYFTVGVARGFWLDTHL